MAGNKINTKKREDKSKLRNSSQVNEDVDDIDFSLLRKPILTSVTGFSQAKKIFEVATEELKGLISNECDLLYECKVCRNIFRSLVNFVSHKRIYCKEKFNSSVHGHFIKPTVNEVSKIKQLEQSYQESLKELNKTEDLEESPQSNERIPLTKDLSTVIERIAKTKAVKNCLLENQQVTLQKIPKTSVAVFQNITYNDGIKTDSMKAQVQELNKISSQENAVLQGNGKFKLQNNISTDVENVIQISDDDDNEDTSVLKCKLCDQQFSTHKTLKVHIKYKHLENRLVYPCPDCLEIFSTSWSVYRHLFKVHRKSAAQIRRLRESIQAKAFRMDNPPAFYEKRKSNMKNVLIQKKTEEERLEQENQEWMDNMEGDGELPRCGGCGRTFERRAALAAHTNTCQPRSRALARRPQETKKIEIQIRKDYNKGPSSNTIFSAKSDTSEAKDENKDVQSKNIPDKDDSVEFKENNVIETKENNLTEAVMSVVGEVENESMDKVVENKEPTYEYKFINRLPYAYQAEKSNVHALKLKMEQDVDLESFLCKKCDINCTCLQQLLDHMAEHYKWMRYGCKLCNYKHYQFEKLPEHIKTVHKLKGDTDFYFSTLKAIDGSEALEMSDSTSELNDENCTSPNSRRPSRCSSDSSRLSDDSTSSSIRVEGSRKRKIYLCKSTSKRKKETSHFDRQDTVSTQKMREKTMNESNRDTDSTVIRPKALTRTERLRLHSQRKKQSKENSQQDNVAAQKTRLYSQRQREKTVNESNGDTDSSVMNSGDDQNEETRQVSKVIAENDSSSNSKTFEENSSDIDEIEEKTTRNPVAKNVSSVASRRPVRNKTKPKYKDFEYDLSNLLKMEAQGYRDSQGLSIKSNNSKKRSQQDTQNNYDIINKEFSGALAMLSRKSLEITKATVKSTFLVCNSSNNKGQRLSNIFAKPLAPKIAKIEKVSPKKDVIEVKDDHSPTKDEKPDELNNSINDELNNSKDEILKKVDIKEEVQDTSEISPVKDITTEMKDTKIENDVSNKVLNKEIPVAEKEKTHLTGNVNIPKVFPFKFKSNLDVMKNPLIKKNLTDFTKAGMKTKILVIKPINRNKDGTQTLNTPLKFQTIKLKDPNKDKNTNEEKKTDQVVVVPVPKVDCSIRPAPSVSNIDNDIQSLVPTTSKSCVSENVIVKSVSASDEMDIDNSEITDIKGKEKNHSDLKDKSASDKMES